MTRDEYYEKRRKREEENSSLSSPSNAYQRYAERQMSSSFGNAYNEGIEALNNIYSGWNSAEQFATNRQIAMNSAQKMDEARSKYGIDTYDDLIKNYYKGLNGIDSAAEVYSQYLNADAYNKAQKKSEIANKYKGASYADIKKALESAEDLDEKNYLKSYTDFSSLEDFDQAIADEQATVDEMSKNGRKDTFAYQEKLKEARDLYSKEHARDKYDYLLDEADFAELSKDDSALYAHEQVVALDPISRWMRGNVAYADSLSDEDKAKAIYLYNKDRANGIDPTSKNSQYLQYMKDMTYTARQNEAAEIGEELSAHTEEHPVLSAIEYPMFNAVMGGAQGFESLASKVRGNTDVTTLDVLNDAVNAETSKITQNIKANAGDLPAFAYEVFATEVPNRYGELVYGPGYTVVMGTQSFASTYAQDIERGADVNTALKNAAAAGAIEILTELIPWNLAFGKGKKWYTTMAKQMFFEGSEEAIGAIANLVYDNLANGGDSEFNRNVQKYIEMGYSEKDAQAKARKDFAKDTAHQFAVGAFAVAPTTGVAEVANAVQESTAGKFVNREALSSIDNKELYKKYGSQWASEASNREIYNAYTDYYKTLRSDYTEAEKKATHDALQTEYKLTDEEATEWTEALYNQDKKMLKTHFGQALVADLQNNEGWATKVDHTETSKLASKIADSYKMIKTENQVEAEKASKALKTGDKNLVNGKEANILSMKENKDGTYTVKTSEGEVKAKDVTVTNDKATALAYSANIQNEAFKEAYVYYYGGKDISDYDTYARYLYNAGRQGIDYSDNTQILDTLGVAKARALYNIGADQALQENIATSNALEEVGNKYAEKYRPGTFKSGDYKDGKFKENKDFFRNLNQTQKKLYRVVESFSKLSGVNVRVYLDRDAASENGQFIAGKDGGTIYINLAARPFADNAYGINQYVISTLSHELTHWLKFNNREAYDILEEAVKKDLQNNGTFEERLKTEKESLLKVEENKNREDLDEIALEEVVARACEDMLNDSDTMQEVLSFADQDGLTKLQAALNKWFEHIRAFFRDLMGGFHSPNEVVADLQKDYTHLQELWVKGIKEAIAQNRKEQKTKKTVASNEVRKSLPKSVMDNLSTEDAENYQAFSKVIEDYLSGNYPQRQHLKIMGYTPSLLQQVGLGNKEIYMTKTHYNDITHPEDGVHDQYHGLSDEEVMQAPILLNNAAIIMDSITQPSSVIVVSQSLDYKKRPIIMALKTDGEARSIELVDSNFMTSMYGKDEFKNWIDQFVQSNDILYIDSKKIQALKGCGVQFSLGFEALGFDTILHQSRNAVKSNHLKSVKMNSRTELNKVEKVAKEHFGTTDDFREAGYILLDGSKLDFSGAHWLDKDYYSPKDIADWKKKNDLRQVDHEDIAEAYEEAGLNFTGDNRLKFINQGNIRLMPEYGAMELAENVEPTEAQYSAIKDYVYDFVDKYTSGLEVEIDGIPQTIKYSKNTNATRIVNDIKAYYRDGVVPTGNGEYRDYRFSKKISDQATLKFLNDQIKKGEYTTTYKSMSLDDGKLHSPMAALINGKYENDYELGKWYEAVEHPELAKGNKFDLNKGKGLGTVPARYNPYEHSSNLVINDQFTSAYKRPNLVTVEMRIPNSELTSGYKAEGAKDSVGWTDWKSGEVANELRKKGIERKVLLSRYAMPVRIVSDKEVAEQYKELIDGTSIEIPENVVTPGLLGELEKLNVPIKRTLGEKRLSAKIDSNKKNPASFRGKEFWSGSVSLLDGEIEEVHTYEEAEKADFHHSLYFSDEQVEKLDSDDNAFFFVNNGEIEVWRDDIPEWVIGRIYEQLDSKNEKDNSVETIGAADVDTKTHTAVYSVRYTLAERYKELGYNSYAEAVGDTAAKIAKQMGVSKLKAEDWIKAEESLANIILRDAENQRYLDYSADDRYTAIKTDTDYPQGTIDLSNLCRKREIFTKMFDSLQRENPDILFTAEDIAKIRQILTEANYEVACALCYVEDRRQHIGEIAESFGKSYRKALASKNKVIHFTNSKGEVKPLIVTKDQASKYGLKQGEPFKATDSYVPNQYDLTTYQGYKELTEKHPTVAVAFERFNNARGQSAARLIEGHAEYKREILDWKESDINKANNHGGLRVFSFSDFEAIHLIDIVQVVMDCSVQGVKIQAYTKVPSFANLVKNTGMKLNRSLIPANKGSKNAYAYINGKAVKIDEWADDGIGIVDGKEVLAFDIVEGIDITDKNFLDMSNNKNVGNVLVGINEKQIRLAMENDFIDYIIPFHTNQANAILEAKGIHKWDNYKLSQLDKQINGKGGHGVNIYTDVINKYNIRDKKDFVRAFLNECKNQKYKPRFAEFLNTNSKGEYIYTEGYHKFLVDYKLFDTKGNILKQEAVKPDFDIELMNEILLADKARSMNMQFSDEIMDKVRTELSNDKRTIKKSTKMDSEGNTLTKDQANYFKDSKIVDENGRLKLMYHGTNQANFTIFDNKFSDDKLSFFFTDSPKVATSYSGSEKKVNPYVTKPIEKITDVETAKAFLEEYGFAKDFSSFEEKAYGRTYRRWSFTDSEDNRRSYGNLTDKTLIEWAESERKTGRGLYEVYLNITNPYIMDCHGRNWNWLRLPIRESTEDQVMIDHLDYLDLAADVDESVRWQDMIDHLGELEYYSNLIISDAKNIYGIKVSPKAEKELLEQAKKLDEMFKTWDESKHIDEDEGPVGLKHYLQNAMLPKHFRTREISAWAKEKGYDGVYFLNLVDIGPHAKGWINYGTSNIAIAFYPEQIKSAHNEHPTKDKDIRYSEKLNSEGRELTVGQQTYFKDSKVRDDQGRLLVVYHGTNEEFDTFKPNRFIKEQNGVSRIMGYFSEDKSYAEIYGDTKPYYLNITNPLVLDESAKTLKAWKTFFKKNGITGVVFDSSVTGKNGQIDHLKGGTYDGETYYAFYELLDMSAYWYGDGNLTEKIAEAGYDGIQSNDEYEKAWMPFNAEAIKSVDNENPTDNESTLKSTKLPPEAQKLVDELTLENKRLTEENTALKAEKGIEKVKAEKNALIDKITETAQTLSRWLLTNDKNNPVPQALKEPVGELLTSISYTKDDYEWRKVRGNLTKSEETLGERMAKISQLLTDIKQDKVNDKNAYDLSQLDWIPEFTEEFAKIKDTVASVEAHQGKNFNLSKMTTEDLKTLSNMITALKYAITNMNRCLSAHNKMSVSGVGQEIVSYLDSVGQKKFDNRALQFLEIDNTVPYYFFKRLGSGGQKAFKLLMDGMNQYAFEAKQIEDYAHKVFSGKDVLAWRDQVKTFEIEELTLGASGTEVISRQKRQIQMTVPQIMSLYCLAKRDQAMNHLNSGGIRVGDFKTKNDKTPIRQVENVTITEKNLEKILSTLTKEQIEVADKLQEFMNTTLQKWGNEVTMKRFGFKGFTEKNYFPIIVDKNQRSSEARQRGTSLYQLLNMGFTKPINPKAKNPIEIFDIFEVFAMHSTEMAQYHSLALPVLDVIRIWNYKDLEVLDENENKAHWHSVKSSIENTIGAKGNSYIGLLLADLNGDVSGGRADDFAARFVKNYKTAAVAANLQVAALQPLAYIRAGYVLDPKYLSKGMAMKSTDDALKWCGIAVWKDMGFYNTAIHRGLEHKIMQDDTKKEKLVEKGLWLAGKADEWTWSKLWNACLVETEDKYPDLKGDDLYKQTAERLTEVIYGTQVVDSILTRSQLMRDPTMYSKMVTAFNAEPTLGLNVLMDATESFSMEARANGAQAALHKYGKTMGRAATVYLLSCAIESALRTVIGKIRNFDGDDEDDESFIKDFLTRFIEELNPLGKIPIVKDVVGVIGDVLKVKMGMQYRIYTDTRMDEAIFEQIGKAVIRITNLIEGKEANFKALYEIARGLDASGLPISSTFRTFKVAWNNTIGRIWNSLMLK